MAAAAAAAALLNDHSEMLNALPPLPPPGLQTVSDTYMRNLVLKLQPERLDFKRRCLASVDAGPDAAVAADHTINGRPFPTFQATTADAYALTRHALVSCWDAQVLWAHRGLPLPALHPLSCAAHSRRCQRT